MPSSTATTEAALRGLNDARDDEGVGFSLWMLAEIVMAAREPDFAEESVEVVKTWLEERNGVRLRCFRLSLRDGTVLDVSRPDAGGLWTVDRERDDQRTLP